MNDECQKVWNFQYHSINFKDKHVSSFEDFYIFRNCVALFANLKWRDVRN